MNKQVELFRSQKQYIVNYVKNKGVEKISLYSATTSIPLIAIYTFVKEDLPEYTELCDSKIKELEDFYGL